MNTRPEGESTQELPTRSPGVLPLSAGGRRLVRTCGGVTHTYSLVDAVLVASEQGVARKLDVAPSLRTSDFDSRLCGAGHAAVVAGASYPLTADALG
jgi:hypothetical protein